MVDTESRACSPHACDDAVAPLTKVLREMELPYEVVKHYPDYSNPAVAQIVVVGGLASFQFHPNGTLYEFVTDAGRVPRMLNFHHYKCFTCLSNLMGEEGICDRCGYSAEGKPCVTCGRQKVAQHHISFPHRYLCTRQTPEQWREMVLKGR